jgi:PD-(D/E)XK nuclease superfamily protein
MVEPAEGEKRFELLTESRSSVARRCAREQHNRYDLGFVPLTALSEPLRVGTLGHLALEAWWALSDGGELEHTRLAAALSKLHGHAGAESDAFELVRLEEMLRGYHARWGEEHFEVIGVELEFRGPLINPETGARSRTFERGGKLDALVRDIKGRKLIVEHKFSGEDIGPGSSFWARLRMGGQAAGYIRGAEYIGHPDVVGVIYDVIGKPRLRPHKATPEAERKYTQEKLDKKTGAVLEPSRLYSNQRDTDENAEEYRERVRHHIASNPDHYFQRGLVVRLEEQMVEHDREAWLLAVQIREDRRLGIHPRNPDACQRFGSVCPYFGVCCGEASLDDPTLFRQLAWPHPELSPTYSTETET